MKRSKQMSSCIYVSLFPFQTTARSRGKLASAGSKISGSSVESHLEFVSEEGKNMLKIGAPTIRQAIRTAVAGVLAMYFSKFLGLPEGYWAAISAVIVMQANLGGAIRESWVRVAATAIGATVAIPFVYFFGGNLIAFGVAVIATIVLCMFLNLQAGLRVAATTVAIILLIPHAGRSWLPAIHRFLEVSFGIIVALVVAKFLWPSSALESLQKGLANAFLELNSLLLASLDKYQGKPGVSAEELHKKCKATRRRNDDLRAESHYELALGLGARKTLAELMEHEDRLRLGLEAVYIAADNPSRDDLYLKFEPEFSELCEGVSVGLQRIAQGLLRGNFTTAEFDFGASLKTLDSKAEAVRQTRESEQFPLQEIVRFDSLYFGLETLARELAEAQICARDHVAPVPR
jgi:uncharacterized membrane protein YccC